MDPGSALRIAHANVQSKVFGDEAVVLDMSTGTYYSLLGSAVDVWEMASANATPDAIRAGLGRRYAAPSDVIDAAVAGCLADLLEAGLVVLDETIAPGSPQPAAGPAEAFVVPAIERFTDMEDMLMLDPIHEVDASGWPHKLAGA
jgi:Coenzyme PQQ synthesis protein D (PqqD)